MTCYEPNLEERSWYTPKNFNASFGDYINGGNRKPWSVGLRMMAAPRGEIRLLSEVSDTKLHFVPSTENNVKPELFPSKEHLRCEHDYEWHATPIEIIGPWAHGWIPGEHGWQLTAQSKVLDGAPARYGNFFPWELNSGDMNFDYHIEAADPDEAGDEESFEHVLPSKISKNTATVKV